MRALASQQCGPVQIPASTPYVGWVCCWFSPLLREVFLRVLRFSPLLQNQHFQLPIRPEIRYTENHFVDVLPPNRYLFIYYLFIIHCHIPKNNHKCKLTHSPLSRLQPPIRIPLVTSSVLTVKDNFVSYCNFNYILFYLRCKNMASDWKSMDLKRSLWKTN